MEYSFYVLKSMKFGHYYIGSTNNLKSRLAYHNSGRVNSTRAYLPWKLIYSETFDTKKNASQREFQVKTWKSREAIERLIKKNAAIV